MWGTATFTGGQGPWCQDAPWTATSLLGGGTEAGALAGQEPAEWTQHSQRHTLSHGRKLGLGDSLTMARGPAASGLAEHTLASWPGDGGPVLLGARRAEEGAPALARLYLTRLLISQQLSPQGCHSLSPGKSWSR